MAENKKNHSEESDIVVLKRVAAQEASPTAVYPIPGGSQRVRFENPFDMETERFEKFADLANVAERTGKYSALIKFWMTAEDYKLLNEAYPTPRAIGPVVKAVMAHYETDSMGLGD